MKKYMLLFALMLMGFGVSSCSNETSNDASEDALGLVAPNGEKIAESIDEIRWFANDIIKTSYGEEMPFTITGIEYYPAKDGYIALVNYVMSDGISSNFVISNSVDLISNTRLDKLYAKNFSEGDMRWNEDHTAVIIGSDDPQIRLDTIIVGNIIYHCESGGCQPCEIAVVPSGGYSLITCIGCDDCKLSAVIYSK